MKKVPHRLLQAALFVLLLGGDQLSKQLIVQHVRGQGPLVLIPGVLEFVYTENTGAAFSSFEGMSSVLLVVGLALMAAVCFLVVRIPTQRKWLPLQYTLVLLVAGGLGNILDRIFRGFVVDFIYFVPINFPRFNLADSCVVVAIILLFLLILFKYKEGDLKQLFTARKNKA